MALYKCVTIIIITIVIFRKLTHEGASEVFKPTLPYYAKVGTSHMNYNGWHYKSKDFLVKGQTLYQTVIMVCSAKPTD